MKFCLKINFEVLGFFGFFQVGCKFPEFQKILTSTTCNHRLRLEDEQDEKCKCQFCSTVAASTPALPTHHKRASTREHDFMNHVYLKLYCT